ncbi:Hypothetical_protein [Hexamita inflata]|uniref:Hypothetical_protein n=1 Tax=Hexamita inflata TaxID=28002 RepID=A0AA86NWQ7_9EUKA|nr:Hypothetical protein HINF_LOCUS14150 [Hexamita inflata]CAI9926512.1 Hypothetical protein HINF_LOCUS14157 [Hexamita inflata]
MNSTLRKRNVPNNVRIAVNDMDKTYATYEWVAKVNCLNIECVKRIWYTYKNEGRYLNKPKGGSEKKFDQSAQMILVNLTYPKNKWTLGSSGVQNVRIVEDWKRYVFTDECGIYKTGRRNVYFLRKPDEGDDPRFFLATKYNGGFFVSVQVYADRDEFVAAIQLAWTQIGQDVINSLFDSIPNRIKECIEKKGGNTHY